MFFKSVSSISDSKYVQKMENQKPISAPTSFKPYSLQHWALSTTVKSVIEDISLCFFNRRDILLFDKLKLLHRRGTRFLDYEFTYDERTWVTLGTIINDWEQRHHGSPETSLAAKRRCIPLFFRYDDLKPFCGCRGGKTRVDGHSLHCDRYE